MKCNLCRLLPNDHSFKVCRWDTCDCGCIMKYLNRPKNRFENAMRKDTPEWLNIGVSELKRIKIPKVYSDYMHSLWNNSRGIAFRQWYVPAYEKDLKKKRLAMRNKL